jgi:hypothetical protein
MANNNSILVGLSLILVGFAVFAFVPLVPSMPKTIAYTSGIVEPSRYLYIEKNCQKGTLTFSFESSRDVDAFIFDEGQYYAFHNSVYSSSLSVKLSSESGTLSCTLDEPASIYFVIKNNDDRNARIESFRVRHTLGKITVLQNLKNISELRNTLG